MTAPSPPHSRYTAAQRRWIFTGCLTAMMVSSLEATIVATAMPAIVSELGGFDLFSWVFAAYLLCQSVTIPICGRLADLYGRRPVFIVGMGLFLIGSLLCGFARSMIALVIFRAIQGLGAGGVMPMVITINADIYSPTERAAAQGYISTVWGASAIMGPIVGALLVEHASWAWVFWINVPFGIVGLAIVAAALRETRPPRRQRIDVAASLLLIGGLGAVMLALVQWTHFGWPARGLLIGGGAAALVILLLHERTSAQPVLPLEVWRVRAVVIANSAVSLIAAITMAITAFLPTYVHAVFGGGPMAAGAAFGAMMLAWPIAGAVGPRLSLRSSFRHVAVLGGVLLVTGSVTPAAIGPASGSLYATIAAWVIGFGVGFSNNNYMLSTQVSVPYHQRGLASSTNMFTRIVGTALGAAVFGGVVNYELSQRAPGSEALVEKLLEPAMRDAILATADTGLIGHLAAAIQSAFILSAVLSVGAFILSWFVPRGLSLRSPTPDR